MLDATLVRLIETEFGLTVSSSAMQPLGSAGGFSGATFWRFESQGSRWCLRRWPQGTNKSRVDWIHGILRDVANSVSFLAVPFRTRKGTSTVEFRDGLFEVSPWLPGVADYEQHPSPERLAHALTALGEFHRAAATVDRRGAECPSISPGLRARVERCDRYLQGELYKLRAAWAAWPDKSNFVVGPQLCETILDGFDRLAHSIQPMLRTAATLPIHAQPCLRDIWHDHVLFTGDKVTGVVDYDALRIECPACDIARLLGSLVGNEAPGWRLGIEAYQRIRQVSDQELDQIAAFDWGNLLLSGLQWLEWILLEKRSFLDRAAVARRLTHWAERIAGRQASQPIFM